MLCLGATGAQTLVGRKFSITKQRCELRRVAPWAELIMATHLPSALLRM
jgi:hypothetical protein